MTTNTVPRQTKLARFGHALGCVAIALGALSVLVWAITNLVAYASGGKGIVPFLQQLFTIATLFILAGGLLATAATCYGSHTIKTGCMRHLSSGKKEKLYSVGENIRDVFISLDVMFVPVFLSVYLKQLADTGCWIGPVSGSTIVLAASLVYAFLYVLLVFRRSIKAGGSRIDSRLSLFENTVEVVSDTINLGTFAITAWLLGNGQYICGRTDIFSILISGGSYMLIISLLVRVLNAGYHYKARRAD